MNSDISQTDAIIEDLSTREHADLADVVEMLTRLEQLRLQDLTPAQMAQQMKDESVDCPGGGEWNAATVTTILDLVESFQQEEGTEPLGSGMSVPAGPWATTPTTGAGHRQPVAPAGTSRSTERRPLTTGELSSEELAAGIASRRLSTVLAVVAALAFVGAGVAAYAERDSITRALDRPATSTSTPTTAEPPASTTTSAAPEEDMLAIRIEPPEVTEAREAGELVAATATIREGLLHFEGAFRSQAEADRHIAKATQVFGADAVVEDYVIDPGAPDPQAADVALDKPVLFETGTAIIDPSYIPFLEACGNVLLLNPHITMSISGFADSTGPEDLNLELSQQRAQAIIDFYRSMEVPTEQLIGVGYGESDPVGDNSTEEGRQANRRAMLQLLDVMDDPAEEG